ncbi:MAG: cell division protein FtsL [Geminicoccales bacterium]
MLKLSIASLLIAVLAACGVYAFKGETQGLERDLRRVERMIDKENFEITRLKAEWATLSDPARLTRLAEAHLELKPAEPRQIAGIDDIPLRSDLDHGEAPALVSSIDPAKLGAPGAVSQ